MRDEKRRAIGSESDLTAEEHRPVTLPQMQSYRLASIYGINIPKQTFIIPSHFLILYIQILLRTSSSYLTIQDARTVHVSCTPDNTHVHIMQNNNLFLLLDTKRHNDSQGLTLTSQMLGRPCEKLFISEVERFRNAI